ncbi:hypothetical protein F511_41640 [Dorcoceras hygrometricum]|uniref:Delphilin-like n=1 Tax=Dorcoceras hygrometricum TaxID=472368 RepID=A0A2Z7BH03_9LAMI|nr:hypothetical protein F511_41640 [Dorcoceras hygrometricum]
MFRGNSDAYVSAIVGRLLNKKQKYLRQPLVICSQETALLTKSYFRHSLHSKSTTMASVFFVNSYQINFESVLMIPDHDGMLNMFKALEASGLRGFLGCESVLYEKELEQFFETALVQGEDITGTVSGKFFSISQARFAHVFELPTEGVVNFSEAVTVKAGSFDAVTTERFQMMTEIHYGLKVNWGKVLFNVLKDMVDKSQRKAKGFAAQIGVLLKGIPAIALGEGVPFPFAKILSMKTVNTYIATYTTIDAREEQGMVISEVAGSKKRVATEDIAPAIPKKRRTVKTKSSSSQASLDIMPVAQDVVPIQPDSILRQNPHAGGEIGSSSRRLPPIRVERRPLPTPANQGESSSGHGRVPSVEEAAEMIREADRQAYRREREREREKRLRRLRRRGH